MRHSKRPWVFDFFQRSAFLLFSVCLLYMPFQALADEGDISQIRKGVIKITVMAQTPDYTVPWNPGQMGQKIGTGFIIRGNHILTNAHLASNARFLAVEKEGDSRRYEARVRFIAHDCDLAMLEVLDSTFLDGTIPLSIGGIPTLNSIVNAVGYPIGGSRLSITRGVVSRIDYQAYSHSILDQHLAIQIDAAINPGNSGGPVLQGDKVVGVAFQGYRGDVAQNVGYMIPVPVIERFLRDISDGQYDGYVDLGIQFFALLNGAHRRALGLGPGDYGVMVSDVYKEAPCEDALEVGDILLAIDGLAISSDGYVAMEGERLHMAEVVERKLKGDEVRLDILREGQHQEIIVSLSAPWPFQLQSLHHDVRPRFVLFGGLVFQPLSRRFIMEADIRDGDIRYYFSYYLDNELYLDTPEIIVLSQVLPDPINVYLKPFVNGIVETINGRRIRVLEDVADAFEASPDYYVVEFKGNGRPLVLERKAVQEARERILSRYGVLQEQYLGDSFVPSDWYKKNQGE
jgi:S1-C subfamily serine protease